jgi:hypothetical protein
MIACKRPERQHLIQSFQRVPLLIVELPGEILECRLQRLLQRRATITRAPDRPWIADASVRLQPQARAGLSNPMASQAMVQSEQLIVLTAARQAAFITESPANPSTQPFFLPFLLALSRNWVQNMHLRIS